MDKKSKVAQILLQIKDQSDELLDSDGTIDMTPEEIIVLATELVTSSPISNVEYGSPVASVDRSQVSFMLDDDFEAKIYGEDDENI